MKVKLDENMPASAATALIEAGHDIETAYTENLAGAPDFQIAFACRDEARALLTLDLDFANIAAYPPHEHSGIIVLRPHSQSVTLILALVKKILAAFTSESPEGALWIVEADRMRIYKP